MDKFIIKGGTPLKGTIAISGSKNAALPVIAGALLADSPVTIHNIPRLQDIYTFNNVLRVVGAKVDFKEQENTVEIDPTLVSYLEAPYDLVRKMRASFYMLGALVGKHGYAKVSLPGGCAWGPRPVDLHLKGMEAMGIKITLDKGYVIAKADQELNGESFTLKPSSVGATVNLLLAAVLRAKKFTINNAAKEPDVVQLCNFLVKMGANIEGIGTSALIIRKVEKLNGVEISNDPDRIELGTYMIAGAMHPDSELTLTGCNADHLGNFPDLLRQTGTEVTIDGSTIHIKAPKKLKPVSVKTDIYPGFPTDLQAQWATMLTQAEGESSVTDSVYFDRFSYVPELTRLGANMHVDQNTVHIKGKTPLTGASVMSTDLRASVSLVLAAMIAKNTTEVLRVYHLDRGYESLENKLNPVGAKITRAEDN
ncbi:MAG: UDP-N-acetylglucosamine 1-carboxyvinyltransferase [Balneolaceae bacterium]|nr:UDP-N-acetylglucosamine 1-carboxyvinyltransferase [Balneolaceae bacterium]